MGASGSNTRKMQAAVGNLNYHTWESVVAAREKCKQQWETHHISGYNDHCLSRIQLQYVYNHECLPADNFIADIKKQLLSSNGPRLGHIRLDGLHQSGGLPVVESNWIPVVCS